VQPSNPEATDSSSPRIPNRPNLAEDEFIQLDVDNLIEAEPSESNSVVETPSCGRQFYCVMVENPNQAEYDKTRELVGDAYLREFQEVGQVLQVGAFKRASEAKNLQRRLDQQGINATIYYP
ncbi:MAG: SPOR domain-containing protein, partial [Halothece sp. Uz-M2-17]|nr:SPOR domain-containing protein [Halothece sp. Uz-M2-17]